MKLKNKYILLRHGETIYQTKKKGLLYPWTSVNLVGLTKKGKEQVKSVVEKFKAKNVDLIYSSDFLRTCQTAEIVAKILGLKIIFDKRLRDINFGIFYGGKIDEYRKFFTNKKQKFFKRPPKGESWRDVKKRTIDFIKDIEKKYKNKTIIIISHGDPIWLLNGFLKGLNEKELLEKNQFDDTFSSVKGFYPGLSEFLEVK
ncbi:MAG: hypothetical protein COU42_02260 [Candidatus Nealsonbacteria bacterium CG10_big_fil_rev_8_21_14_0_10_36_24]|uniref:Histidine phosphatase family protein n=2 Tax=Candidatus Nealsoniibacteriota TaxID=1817911 RepID=A0A2H0YP35_9BACT|nr:MAG: hypothetical protein COU42_02260 [Candidatus Nealsonbacteria bacterium CG10_big_fil_rev_8_21_14_0_10_36_24]PIS40264.1 MAG: hypothetical protein COT32_00750 [Candidatus Nealsonbacteria bacterium CG08_land_8_20_14_0_20_36_22]